MVVCCIFASHHSLGGDDGLSYACDKGGATRYVEVVSAPAYACRVKYTKASATTFPWNARKDASYCPPKAKGLVAKLGSLGWECDSSEDVKSILLAQIERYDRYIKILKNVGRTCNFYPTEAQFGNLCGDARDEAIIVYSCEGDSDGWDQHLAVFLELESDPLISVVGDSEHRQVSAYYIEDKRVVMETENFDPVEDSNATQQAATKASIQCQYSAASKWELIEK
ncbi:MAG: hypothetical protein GY896_22420 [Gammaproteobacteria bacterium]|nr:hypothetical protein [Gammaproteobacteria bacterium]